MTARFATAYSPVPRHAPISPFASLTDNNDGDTPARALLARVQQRNERLALKAAASSKQSSFSERRALRRPAEESGERFFGALEQHFVGAVLSLLLLLIVLRIVSAYGQALVEVNLRVDKMARLLTNVEQMDEHFSELDSLIDYARLLQAQSRLWMAYDIAWQNSAIYVFVSQHNAILTSAIESLLRQHLFSAPLFAVLIIAVVFICGRTIASIARAYMNRQAMREMGREIAGAVQQHQHQRSHRQRE
jgi:hypothetical protein